MGKLGLEKVSKSVNKIIIYQFSMFKSLDSITSVVGIFMYLTISKFKQVLRSRLQNNTAYNLHVCAQQKSNFQELEFYNFTCVYREPDKDGCRA